MLFQKTLKRVRAKKTINIDFKSYFKSNLKGNLKGNTSHQQQGKTHLERQLDTEPGAPGLQHVVGRVPLCPTDGATVIIPRRLAAADDDEPFSNESAKLARLQKAYRIVYDQASEADKQKAAASEALRIATRRYDAGYSGYLEVLDAQRSVQDADLALLRTRQQRLDASVALIKALGGGWAPPALTPRHPS